MNNEPTNNTPLHITRTFSAPRMRVWDAWTKPELLSKWYAPAPFTIPVCELDVREGGVLRIEMRAPDGTTFPSSGVFKEVIAPERLVFTNSPLAADGTTLFEIMHTMRLTEEDSATTLDLTSSVVFAGPDAKPYLSGMEAGLAIAIEQLHTVVAAS
jgi:uncharacterized protein YndB with AHSA1/START domain